MTPKGVIKGGLVFLGAARKGAQERVKGESLVCSITEDFGDVFWHALTHKGLADYLQHIGDKFPPYELGSTSSTQRNLAIPWAVLIAKLKHIISSDCFQVSTHSKVETHNYF